MREDLFRGPGSCLLPAELERFLEDNLDPGRTAHAWACPHCLHEADLLRRFLSETAMDEEEAAAVECIEARLRLPAEASPRRYWPAWRIPVLVPALALAAFVGVAIQQQARLRPSVSLESLQPGGPVRGAAFRILAPQGDLDTAPAALAWTSLPGAALYRAEFTLPDGASLGSVHSRKASAAAPAFVKTALRAGRTLRWRVVAIDAAGRKISETDWRQVRQSISTP